MAKKQKSALTQAQELAIGLAILSLLFMIVKFLGLIAYFYLIQVIIFFKLIFMKNVFYAKEFNMLMGVYTETNLKYISLILWLPGMFIITMWFIIPLYSLLMIFILILIPASLSYYLNNKRKVDQNLNHIQTKIIKLVKKHNKEKPELKKNKSKLTDQTIKVNKDKGIGETDKCPYCKKILDKIPTRKSKCPFCGEYIYSRTRVSDRKKVLVTEKQKNKIQKEWDEHSNHVIKTEEEIYEEKKKRALFQLERFKELGFKYVKEKVPNGDSVPEICKKFKDKEFEIDYLLKNEKKRQPHCIDCLCRYTWSDLKESESNLSNDNQDDSSQVNEKDNNENQIELTQSNVIIKKIKQLKNQLDELIITELMAYSMKSNKSFQKGTQLFSSYKLIKIKELSDELDKELEDVNLKNSTNLLFITKAFSISNQYDLFKNISKELTKLKNKVDDKYILMAIIGQLKLYLKKLKKIEKQLEASK